MQGHSAANAMPLICANRIGTETGKGSSAHSPLSITFHGRSFITDASGHKIAEADRETETILIQTVDLDECRRFREEWSFSEIADHLCMKHFRLPMDFYKPNNILNILN